MSIRIELDWRGGNFPTILIPQREATFLLAVYVLLEVAIPLSRDF